MRNADTCYDTCRTDRSRSNPDLDAIGSGLYERLGARSCRHVASNQLRTRKFPSERIILTGFGVNYYGLDSEPGRPLRSSGALVLLRDALYYRARFSRVELTIPGKAITYLGVTDMHKNKPLHQSVVAIRFMGPEGREEKAAFRIPYPAQWVAAIKANLIVGTPRSGQPESGKTP